MSELSQRFRDLAKEFEDAAAADELLDIEEWACETYHRAIAAGELPSPNIERLRWPLPRYEGDDEARRLYGMLWPTVVMYHQDLLAPNPLGLGWGETVAEGIKVASRRPELWKRRRRAGKVLCCHFARATADHQDEKPLVTSNVNDDRDKWLYSEYSRGTKVSAIRIKLERKLPRKPKWEPLGNSGIRAAISRFCQRSGKPRPPRRKAGRPSK